MLLWSAPPPWRQQSATSQLFGRCHSSLCSRSQSFSVSVMCLKSNLPMAVGSSCLGRNYWARHSEEEQPSPSGKCRAQPTGAAAPWRAALPWLHPGSLPGRGCSEAVPDALTPAGAVPSLPFPPPGSPGSRAPTHLTQPCADIWSLLFVFALVWEGSTLNSWSF